MAYTTINKSTDYFNTLLHTGNDASPRSLTGVGFQPDFVWLKRRNDASSHTLYDAVRTAGSAKGLATNATAAEGLSATEGTTANYGYVNSFDSDGFSVTTGASNDNYVNNSGDTYVSWNWKANGAGSANSDGTITSTVSANTTAGFSIVKWTGTASAGTIGHGLGVAPKVVLVKRYSTSGGGWLMQHGDLTGATYVIKLSGTGAEENDGANFNSAFPTSSVFSVYNSNNTNASGADHIAYCFAEKTGFSKFGSYVGNGNTDGTFVYTGFKPAWVLMKNSTQDGDRWTLYDTKRDTINPTYRRLFPDGSLAESTNTDADIDLLSNGFKLRTDAGTTSTSGQTYIYMAFAEEPLVSSNGIPATAR